MPMLPSPASQPMPPPSDKRRSHRLLLQIAVTVRGRDIRQQLFDEESHTLVINAHGGLITLAAIVREGTELSLQNKATGEQHIGTVVFLGPTHEGKREVGFEFRTPAGNFWGVAFPPSDWTPSNQAPPEE